MSAPTEIHELQQLVHEKDDLLKVLTERLEMAAEQLDRLRRQGGALEPASGQSALGPVDDPELADDLRQMLTDWRDLQDRGWFGSLEDRLVGLHDLVSNLEGGSVSTRADELPAKESHAGTEEASPSVADILARYSASTGESAAPTAQPDEPSAPSSPAEEHSTTTLELPDLPPAVDIDHATEDELREALRQREDYIVRLRDYLLAYDKSSEPVVPPADLGSLTADQRAAMEAWEGRIRKELRQTQIQLWVERAQLSREQMQMQQLQHQLDTESKRMGIAKQKGSPAKPGAAGDSGEAQKNKNWLGLFGNK